MTLTAVGTTPIWESDPSSARAGCDSNARWATRGAEGGLPMVAERTRGPRSVQPAPRTTGSTRPGQRPLQGPQSGNGSGKVRGSGIGCGSRCSVETSCGEQWILVADASPGSRFVRWRRGCGEGARCALTVGPITRVTAVFEAVARAASVPPPDQDGRLPGSRRSGQR